LTLKFVGVFAKNREEWLLLDYANILYGNTMIPLYDTLGNEKNNIFYVKVLKASHSSLINLKLILSFVLLKVLAS
jgi:long-subunit acyl-CoA synthetase (AMP-forming)